MDTCKKIIKTGTVDDMKNFLNDKPDYARTAMHIVINSSNRTDMAEEVFKVYEPTYEYVELVERFIDEPDYHIDFDIDKIAPEMCEWVKTHSDIFLKPFTIIRLDRHHDYFRKKVKINY